MSAYSPDVLALNPDLAQAAKGSSKGKLRGKDGGKHPHVKNTQDYDDQEFRTPSLYYWNVGGALAVLGHPKLKARLLEARPDTQAPLEDALTALETLHKLLEVEA
jgi:hypothetical protein